MCFMETWLDFPLHSFLQLGGGEGATFVTQEADAQSVGYGREMYSC